MEKSKIKSIKAKEILDSRGNLTLEVELETNMGIFLASVPSGASVGQYEAVAKPAKIAVKNVNKIIRPKLTGRNPTKQKEIDDFLIKLDGTKNKSRLGANAILGVSMATCRAGAAAKNLPLYQYISELWSGTHPSERATPHPRPARRSLRRVSAGSVLPIPCFNIINGGVHAGNELDFQEFMLVPQEKVFSKNLQIGVEIYQELKKILKKKYGNLAINLGDEGGFAPAIKFPEEAVELILEATKELNYEKKIKIIIDVAASQFFKNKKYKMKIGVFNREKLLSYYLDLIQKYPIIGLEDPFSEDDFRGWKLLKLKMKNEKLKILVIGDDLLATNPIRMKMAKENNLCNAVIIKPNQIGTISETIEAVKLARSYNWKTIVSHRSGETNDDFISDLAIGMGADFIKAGAPARGERVAKYNRLLKIEKELIKY